jgi:hypothetical protein
MQGSERTGRKLLADNPWSVVFTASGMTQAKIITGRLETEGIPTLLKYEAAGPIYAITIDGLGEVKVLVPEEAIARACAVLEQSYEEQDIDWEDAKICD